MTDREKLIDTPTPDTPDQDIETLKKAAKVHFIIGAVFWIFSIAASLFVLLYDAYGSGTLDLRDPEISSQWKEFKVHFHLYSYCYEAQPQDGDLIKNCNIYCSKDSNFDLFPSEPCTNTPILIHSLTFIGLVLQLACLIILIIFFVHGYKGIACCLSLIISVVVTALFTVSMVYFINIFQDNIYTSLNSNSTSMMICIFGMSITVTAGVFLFTGATGKCLKKRSG